MPVTRSQLDDCKDQSLHGFQCPQAYKMLYRGTLPAVVFASPLKGLKCKRYVHAILLWACYIAVICGLLRGADAACHFTVCHTRPEPQVSVTSTGLYTFASPRRCYDPKQQWFDMHVGPKPVWNLSMLHSCYPALSATYDLNNCTDSSPTQA